MEGVDENVSRLKAIELEIVPDFDEIVRDITWFLTKERDRLLEVGSKLVSADPDQNLSLRYRRTPEFSVHLEALFNCSVGKFEVEGGVTTKKRPALSISGENNDNHQVKQRRQQLESKPPLVISSVEEETLKKVSPISSPILSDFVYGGGERQVRKPEGKFPYENMKLLASRKFEKPSALVAMPHKKCFVIRHRGGISFVSPSSEILSIHRVKLNKPDSSIPPACISVLALNPLSGDQLLCAEFGRIDSIELTIDYHGAFPSCIRIKKGFTVPHGLAISDGKAKQLYTSFGKSFSNFSLNDWSPTGFWPVHCVSEKSVGLMVLGIREGLLFYKEIGSTSSLYSVPLDEHGNIKIEARKECTKMAFDDVRAITFDNNSNILAADEKRGFIQVLSPDGSEMLAQIRPPSNVRFNPISLALFTVPEGGDLVEFYDGNVKCSHVLAVSNFSNDEVLFFGA